jgi:hypothetical protein
MNYHNTALIVKKNKNHSINILDSLYFSINFPAIKYMSIESLESFSFQLGPWIEVNKLLVELSYLKLSQFTDILEI